MLKLVPFFIVVCIFKPEIAAQVYYLGFIKHAFGNALCRRSCRQGYKDHVAFFCHILKAYIRKLPFFYFLIITVNGIVSLSCVASCRHTFYFHIGMIFKYPYKLLACVSACSGYTCFYHKISLLKQSFLVFIIIRLSRIICNIFCKIIEYAYFLLYNYKNEMNFDLLLDTFNEN